MHFMLHLEWPRCSRLKRAVPEEKTFMAPSLGPWKSIRRSSTSSSRLCDPSITSVEVSHRRLVRLPRVWLGGRLERYADKGSRSCYTYCVLTIYNPGVGGAYCDIHFHLAGGGRKGNQVTEGRPEKNHRERVTIRYADPLDRPFMLLRSQRSFQ
jgi:hypothetical protein